MTQIRKTEKAMMKALLDLLERKGISEVKVNDILDESKIARGTFYRYHKTKEDLMEATICYYASLLDDEIQKDLIEEPTKETMQDFIRFIIIHKMEYRNLNRLFPCSSLNSLQTALEKDREEKGYDRAMDCLYSLFLDEIESETDPTEESLKDRLRRLLEERNQEMILIKKVLDHA